MIRQSFTTRSAAGLAAFALLLGLFLGQVQAAGSASLSMQPATGSASGKTGLAVAVFEDSGDRAVNAVQADISYDSKVLKLTAVDAADSAFDVAAPVETGDGLVKVVRGKITQGVTGKQRVATVRFAVIGAAARSTISFADSSAIVTLDGAQNIWNRSTSGGVFALSEAIEAPEGTARTEAGGYPVSVVVKDKQGVAVSGATVKLGDNQTATTDVKGVASFVNVPEGRYAAMISRGADSGSKEVTVNPASNQAVQEHAFTLASAKQSDKVSVPYLYVVGLVVILLAASFAAWRWHKRIVAQHINQTNRTGKK